MDTIRSEAEALWAASFDGRARSAKGTPYKDYLDKLTPMLEDGEELIYVYGYAKPEKWSPCAMITVTSRRLIAQSLTKLGRNVNVLLKLADIDGYEGKTAGLLTSAKLTVSTEQGESHEWKFVHSREVEGILQALRQAHEQDRPDLYET